MTKVCKLCEERKHEISRILKSYAKDKKLYRYVIIGLFILEIFTIAFGNEGLKMLLDVFKDKL